MDKNGRHTSVHGKEYEGDESINVHTFTGIGNHVPFGIDVVGTVVIASLLDVVAAGEMDGPTIVPTKIFPQNSNHFSRWTQDILLNVFFVLNGWFSRVGCDPKFRTTIITQSPFLAKATFTAMRSSSRLTVTYQSICYTWEPLLQWTTPW